MAKLWQEHGTFVLRDDWQIEDILTEAEAKEVQVSYEQAVRVMEFITLTFDANIGINWDVISNAIDEILYEDACNDDK